MEKVTLTATQHKKMLEKMTQTQCKGDFLCLINQCFDFLPKSSLHLMKTTEFVGL